jgi:hypothetical protein
VTVGDGSVTVDDGCQSGQPSLDFPESSPKTGLSDGGDGSDGRKPLTLSTITDADMDVVDDLFGDDAPGSSRWPDGRERGER